MEVFMFKKMIVLFALVLTPVAFGFNANTDESLMALWTLDDGSGTTVKAHGARLRLRLDDLERFH